MIDNERRLYGYIFKRIGVKGILHHLAFKIGLTQEDKFVYMSKHYYERMAEENYEEELKQWYYAVTGRSGFYVTHPETYNDKIQWLKLYDMSSQKTQLADKYLVREWVAQKIGKKYIIPMYGVWESFSDIKFDMLPNKFVLKCNHGSANNIIVNNKLDINYLNLKKQFDYWMSINYGFKNGFELQYKDIVPKIIAEYKLENQDGTQVEDYKFFVFNGEVKLIQVDIDRFKNHRRNFYTIDWKYIPVSVLYPTDASVNLKKPDCLDKMIDIAQVLGKEFYHVRVDLYLVSGKIFFGEMTFTHGSGVEQFYPTSFGKIMGDWLILPQSNC